MVKAQVYENAQFLYHEDALPSQTRNQNVSDSVQTLPDIFNGTRTFGVNTGTIYQSDAPPDLKVISWAPGVPLRKSRTFAYKSENVGKTTVYIIENGIDGRNRVIKGCAMVLQGRDITDKIRNSFGPLHTGSTPLVLVG